METIHRTVEHIQDIPDVQPIRCPVAVIACPIPTMSIIFMDTLVEFTKFIGLEDILEFLSIE
ncbi:hypothetical protein PCANC_15167 [Puccinia coronata f. sp. avenae]|uniref:Uncharacterized protein n=1 Tax=Puccinia coronata f. sp. avenae TaxID=200324 RepID=A0A2N5UJF3_9BASI|nr:hypothetical protein PCANC_15167 [Puccinia coronata f. sp. avenae]